MADTLEEILNQTFTIDNFTNNSLTLITTDSSTRYVIKDIYVNTDNAATLQNMKRVFLLFSSVIDSSYFSFYSFLFIL